MKKSNSLIILSILIILTACRIERKIEKNTDIVKFEESELFGRWIQTGKLENLENSKKGIISKINLKDDFSAEIEIRDSIGYKTIPGNWKINEEQKIGPESFNISFKSDVILIFDWNNNHRQILSLSVEEINKKKILTSQKGKFEKE